jgi:hypothetical protein
MRTYTSNIKSASAKLILLLALLSTQLSLHATKDENITPFPAGWFKPATGTVYDTLRASSYLASYTNSSGEFLADKPGVRSAFTTITLYINPEVVSSENYDVTLQGYYKRVSPTQPGLRELDRIFTENKLQLCTRQHLQAARCHYRKQLSVYHGGSHHQR